jgi:hypothetical protein
MSLLLPVKEKKNALVLDQFHYHEAMDRTYIAGDVVERMLTEHPVFQKHKRLKHKVERALDILAGVYQELGRMEYEMFDKDKAVDGQ